MAFSETMSSLFARLRGSRYSSLPEDEAGGQGQGHRERQAVQGRRHKGAIKLGVGLVSLAIIAYLVWNTVNVVDHPPAGCDTPKDGFQCHANTSHLWGQYSPFFSLTFAQLLSRHGARDPTSFKSLVYRALVARIQADTTSYAPGYAFLRTYRYTLGSDQLTPFGQAHMFRSGLHFHHRYRALLHDPATSLPFIRASGQARVIHSAQNWTAGFHAGLASSSPYPPPPLPYPILTIPEGPGVNNTLSVKLCPAFLTGPASIVGDAAQTEFLPTFAPPIAARLNAALPGANISDAEVPLLMDLCPYHVVASPSPDAPLPEFCTIFSYSEWQSYDYFQTLGKWFGFGPGNPLGPTQGVGWVNELLARLTDRPVRDGTSTNASLPFPLGRRVYADFGHDNEMVGVLGALGLGGGGGEEWVRVLVNGRVMGCRLGRFVDSMKFAREGGGWERCFV
ncbi:histidine phosphatase superfamily [Schizothecium vesticola]|uniref:3-phytase n=1 Tax=Schizothecium vesticola TaxID=314040 RepID=A0AA40K338_9PEZI|nr:histidine phosphatase superfamily [Schizothecium vesticola]